MSVLEFKDPKYYTETFNKVAPCFYDEKTHGKIEGYSEYRYNIIHGGANSSKSYSAYQRFIQAFVIEKERDFLVMRKHGTSIYDSVFQGMKNIIEDFGLTWMFKFHESLGRLGIYNKLTGRRIVFRGLDDTEKIKSIVNLKYCLLEEATEFSLSDWLEVNRRLRGFEGIKFFLIFNPVSRAHWINKHFFLTDAVKQKTCFVHCTYKDNRFATKEDIESLEGLAEIDENDYRVYCLGLWGVLSSRIIFTNWKEIETVPEGVLRLPSGMDFGFSPDPTTLIDIYMLPGVLILDERIYDTGLVNVHTENELAESIQSRLEEIGFEKELTIVADSAENKSIREIRDAGYNIFAVKKPGITESLKLMKSYKIWVTARSTHVKNELENYVRKIDRNGVILPEPVDGYNHCIDPVRYVLVMKGRLW